MFDGLVAILAQTEIKIQHCYANFIYNLALDITSCAPGEHVNIDIFRLIVSAIVGAALSMSSR